MIVENRRARAHTDWPLIIMVFGMCIFGVLAVCVATYSPSSSSDASLLQHIISSNYAVRQCVFLAMAPIIIGVAMNIPYDVLRRFTPIGYYVGTALLLITFVTNRAAGVKAWMDILWGYTIQPSEFAKLFTILMLAKELARYEQPMSNLKSTTRIAYIVALPTAATLVSGEMGSVLVLFFVVAVMLFFGNVPWRVLIALAVAAILGVLIIYGYTVAFNSDSYRLARILAFFDSEQYASTDAYQMRQSMMTIGSGGLKGIGMFVDGSMSQLNYVPADWTDFIYATIGEAWGFIGCCSVLAAYGMIILRMMYLARYTKDRYGMLVICGVMGMLLFHVFENIGMTIGKMPITGIPLPFLSYGGSNMVTNIGGVALVLNVTKNRSLSHAISTPQLSANAYTYSYSKKNLK